MIRAEHASDPAASAEAFGDGQLRELVAVLDGWAADGRVAALCTIVAVHGRAPLPLGASLAVAADGATAGAISGGCVEREVIDTAQQVLRGAAPRRLRFAAGSDPLTDAGLPCGGGIDVWVQRWLAADGAGAQGAEQRSAAAREQEIFAAAVRSGDAATWRFAVGPVCEGQAVATEPTAGLPSAGGRFALTVEAAGRLVLVGAGPVASALAALAPTFGLCAVIVEPRPAVAARIAIPAATDLVEAWPQEAFGALAPIAPQDAVIALSHQPAIDDATLRAALASGAGFVGALGSRASHAARVARLREWGIPDAALQRIVGPVGLDLGGWAPGEVALSIAAELVATRHGRTGGRLADGCGAIHGPAAEPPLAIVSGGLAGGDAQVAATMAPGAGPPHSAVV
ncbi:MAG: XdhC family protein, partial [Patulibacter sp.]